MSVEAPASTSLRHASWKPSAPAEDRPGFEGSRVAMGRMTPVNVVGA